MAVGPGGLAEAQARIVPHEPEEEGQRQTEFFTLEVSSTKLVAAWQELRAAIPDSCVLPLLVECLRYCSRRTALGSGTQLCHQEGTLSPCSYKPKGAPASKTNGFALIVNGC